MNTRRSPNFGILETGHPGGVPLLPGVGNIEAVHPDVILPLQDLTNTGNTIENTGGLRNTGDQDTLGVGNIEDPGNITGTVNTRDLLNIRETEEAMSALVLMNSAYSVILQERMKTAAGVLQGIHPEIPQDIRQEIHLGIHLDTHLDIHPGIHPARTDVNVLHPSMHFYPKLTARISVPETVDARLLMSVPLGDHAHLKKVQIKFSLVGLWDAKYQIVLHLTEFWIFFD